MPSDSEISFIREDVKILLARYQLCADVAERRRIYDELQQRRQSMLDRLRASCEHWGAELRSTVARTDEAIDEHRNLLVALRDSLVYANGVARQDGHEAVHADAQRREGNAAVATVERVHRRQNFYSEFLAGEDPNHPSESRPHVSCPECNVRGFIRVRPESRNGHGLTSLARRIAGRPGPQRAWCLNCTHVWSLDRG